MRSRLLASLITLWWILWFCLIIPAHTRGAIGIDGRAAQNSQGQSIPLFLSSVASCCQSKSTNPKCPPTQSSSNCLICKTIAATGLAPKLTSLPALTLLIKSQLPPRASQVRTIDFLPTFQGRAPPSTN